jgi:hypothetical protein
MRYKILKLLSYNNDDRHSRLDDKDPHPQCELFVTSHFTRQELECPAPDSIEILCTEMACISQHAVFHVGDIDSMPGLPTDIPRFGGPGYPGD